MNTIILNSTNKTQSANRFEYLFPSSVKFEKKDEIALQSISLYNSIFNCESQRGNNKISVIWNADTTVQYDFTIPDGFYDISALNYFLQQQCILNDLYCLDADGNYVYFIEIVTNSSQYAGQINCYPLPTAANAAAKGWTIPPGSSWTYPISDKTAQLIIPSVAFGSLIGFAAGTFPTAVQATTQQFLSTKTPQISPVNSILLGCNLINSPYSNPCHLFYSIPIQTQFGGLINVTNSSPIFNEIASGMYSKIIIEFYDQSFESLRLHDFEVVIVLNLKKNNIK